MKMWRAAILLGVAGDLGACETRESTLEIEAYKRPCKVRDLALCFIARTEGDSVFQTFFEPIAGFDFRWGERTTLRLEQRVNQGLVEVDRTWQLLDVLDTVPSEPGDRFSYPIPVAEQDGVFALTLDADGAGGSLLDGRAFTCASPEVCDDLAPVLSDRRGILSVTFAFADPLDAPLIAVGASFR